MYIENVQTDNEARVYIILCIGTFSFSLLRSSSAAAAAAAAAVLLAHELKVYILGYICTTCVYLCMCY